MKKYVFSLEFPPKGPIGHKSAFVSNLSGAQGVPESAIKLKS